MGTTPGRTENVAEHLDFHISGVCQRKQTKHTTKNFKANMIEEQAEAMEELIAALTEKHTQQMETLIKSTTEAMKPMLSLINNEKKETGKQSDEEKKRKQDECRKKYNEAPVCKNCGKKHPTKAEDECSELEKNNDSRPSNWKSTKAPEGARGP
jgi:hypothetical protein